jgi:reactive intermediate/imine deaminase
MNAVQADDAPGSSGPIPRPSRSTRGSTPPINRRWCRQASWWKATSKHSLGSFNNIEAILKAAGGALSQVVKATVFVQDLNEFTRLNAVYERRFAGHQPARSTVEVARLPRDARVGIEIIARLF